MSRIGAFMIYARHKSQTKKQPNEQEMEDEQRFVTAQTSLLAMRRTQDELHNMAWKRSLEHDFMQNDERMQELRADVARVRTMKDAAAAVLQTEIDNLVASDGGDFAERLASYIECGTSRGGWDALRTMQLEAVVRMLRVAARVHRHPDPIESDAGGEGCTTGCAEGQTRIEGP